MTQGLTLFPATVVAASSQMRDLLTAAKSAAESDVPILIEGESGVGKQTLARWINQHRPAGGSSFVHVTGSALKELRPGAEPADWQRVVLGDPAWTSEIPSEPDPCTLYVEHVEELPMWAQRQLLRRIDQTWLSSCTNLDERAAPVRVIASTEKYLEPAVGSGAFARGMYDVLSLTPLSIPPLRKRPDDIRALVAYCLDRFTVDRRKDPGPFRRSLSDQTWEAMQRYAWPGNARELISLIRRALLAHDSQEFQRILTDHILAPATGAEMVSIPIVGNLRSIERSLIREVLRRCGGNKAAAARALGMHRRTLYRVLDTTGPRIVGSPR
jgi:DNA-binding NtrC family response regulator